MGDQLGLDDTAGGELLSTFSFEHSSVTNIFNSYLNALPSRITINKIIRKSVFDYIFFFFPVVIFGSFIFKRGHHQ